MSIAKFLTSIMVVGFFVVNAQHVYAQTSTKKKTVVEAKQDDTGEQTAQPKRTLAPSYDPQLLQLSQALGSLHYLRALCRANEGQKWRNEMEALIAAEEPTAARRENLIAHFNRGFRSFREIYRECTPAASQAAGQYLRQSIRLSTEIPNRFGT